MTIGKDTAGTRVTSLKYLTDSVSNATAENNTTGGAPTIYQVQIDNTASASAVYTKGWDNAAPTVGTTAPNLCLRVAAGAKMTMLVTRLDAAGGSTWQTALSFASVTTGGTAGVTDPTTPPIVRIAAV